ncbi:Zn-dependent exopeptidase [Pilatotrama ljubarskyi]|nr:Zn-dependent exopeptidase [Pilatotrama ljubarskyi]
MQKRGLGQQAFQRVNDSYSRSTVIVWDTPDLFPQTATSTRTSTASGSHHRTASRSGGPNDTVIDMSATPASVTSRIEGHLEAVSHTGQGSIEPSPYDEAPMKGRRSSTRTGSGRHSKAGILRLLLFLTGLLCTSLSGAALYQTSSLSLSSLGRGPRLRPQTGSEESSQHVHALQDYLVPDLCPQAEPLFPHRQRVLDEDLNRMFAEEAFKLKAYEAFGGALRIPTESYEDMGPVGNDSRWDIFGELHGYLQKTFPRVFEDLDVTKVNTYGIVLHWQGANETALPVLMTAHQDVVPVDPSTYEDWNQPPYSGLYDGTWIWGRGSCDDKSDLVASLQAIDVLLEQGFKPRRTFVWAFGFDEESSGTQGAGHLAQYLENRYGTNGFALLLDEGGSAYGTAYGGDVVFAFPALSEKGYLDVQIEVTAPGGHSSVPPAHTAIGMLSAMIVELETQPHPATLTRHSSAYNATQCAARYAPEYPADLRRLAREAEESDEALEELKEELLETFGEEYSALLRTTQAVDLVWGGVKVNALPESAGAVVNHRIVEDSSVADVQTRLASLLRPLAIRFNLTMEAFGRTVPAGTGKNGHLTLSVAFGYELDPSPVTPTGEDPYQVLAGTIRGAILDSGRSKTTEVVVVPRIETGNTDTARYWNLTRNIVRYSHVREGDRYNGFHTVNEAIRAEGWMESARFYTRFILNCDEYL